jgi:hypothetical protein
LEHLTRFPAALSAARNLLPQAHEKIMGIVELRVKPMHRRKFPDC